MGRRLDGFDINLEFDSEGKVSTAEYCDGDGCGHSREFTVGVGSMTTLQEVIDYHLVHYKTGHNMTPRRQCDFKVTGQDKGVEVRFHCTREPHPEGTKHELEQD